MRLKPFALERYFAEHEFSAPHLLCASDCESMTVEELSRLEPGTERALRELRLGYTESLGHPDLRRAIADTYETIAPENVLVFSGAEEAIFAFMSVRLAAGDHAVVHAPGYQSLSEVAESRGAEVTPWHGQEAKGWALDLNFLKDRLRPSTRVVVVNSPHNPTGYLMSGNDLAEVARLADERGATLFSDEVYRGLEYEESERGLAACDLSPRAVSLGVMSKSYGLAGLRIGWIATRDPALYAELAAFKDYTTICSSAPSELLAAVALRHRGAILARNRAILWDNLQLIDRFFIEHSARLEWKRPRAGCIAFPRVKGAGAEALCRDLLARAGVLLAPSTLFHFGDAHFRIGFGRKKFPEALAKLGGHL